MNLSLLKNPRKFLSGRTSTRLAWRVVVYTREQCCCCHKAIDLLKTYQKKHRFTLETIDVDSDPELKRLYDTTVPVVTIDGKVRFKGIVNEVLLNRLIEAEREGR
jgi:glutaredoxin